MPRTRWIQFAIAVPLAAATLLVGCSSADDRGDDTSGRDNVTTTTAPSGFGAQPPAEITAPPAEGEGINFPQPAAKPAEGYVEEEYFVGGTATSFDAIDTPDDGRWTAEPSDTAEYRTRAIVRRPADAADFSGTVLVEWFNVSAIEAAPDWGYLHDAIGRDGHAYVGVSVQAQGVEGGDTLLDVEVDAAQAEEANQSGASTDPSGLRHVDPDRYGTLTHPGDAYSFDILNQVGRAVTGQPAALLGDLAPTQVIAMGESQSAMFMTTYVNAIHPLDPVFDGFLIHSRGSIVPAVDGAYVSNSDASASELLASSVTVRTDLDVPVMMVEAETDLTVLGYANARQPDTDRVRTWEVAGTAHADSETLRAVLGGPRDPGVGMILGCGPVNSGPHKEVLRAAVHHLVGWVGGGDAPPEGERIEMADGDEPAIARDERGNAIGGVRNPMVDVPAATLTGDPPGDGTVDDVVGSSDGICLLFGQTIPFDAATMVELYGDADTYLERFRTSADEAVAAGFMLQPDADALIADVEANRSLFG